MSWNVTVPREAIIGASIGAPSGVAGWVVIAAGGTLLSNLVTIGFSGENFGISLREGRKSLRVLVPAGMVLGGAIGAITA